MSTDFHIRIDDELLLKLREFCREREIGVGKFVCGLIEGKVGGVEVEHSVKVVSPPKPIIEQPARKIEVSEPSERIVYSECCDAPIVRNARNLQACKKCGQIVK